jgi:nitric oxide synthase oxygenase domain/subunit
MATAQALSDAYFGEAMSALFSHRDLEPLNEAVMGALRGYTLGRDEHILIYDTLSGDQLRQAEFWTPFDAGRKLRGKWTHGLSPIAPASSERFLMSVADLIEHIEGRLEAKGVEAPETDVGRVGRDSEKALSADIRRRPAPR